MNKNFHTYLCREKPKFNRCIIVRILPNMLCNLKSIECFLLFTCIKINKTFIIITRRILPSVNLIVFKEKKTNYVTNRGEIEFAVKLLNKMKRKNKIMSKNWNPASMLTM